MSNSPLVNYTKISPNSDNPRCYPITKITIHHVAGNASVESLGRTFANPKRQGSSNYGIGSDGRVGMYVEECNRSWCSGSWSNDNMAVTIEVANDGGRPNWHVSDTALNKLVELCVDICKRNGIEKLNYTGDTTGNLTRHNMFQATTCPGPYLQSKFPWIAEEVNKRLAPVVEEKPVVEQKPVVEEKPAATTLMVGDEVKLVPGATYNSGKAIPAWLFKKTLYVRELRADSAVISTLKVGAITGVVALKYLTKNGWAVTNPEPVVQPKPVEDTKPVVKEPSLAVGDRVKLVAGAKYTSGKAIPAWLFKKTLYVRELQSGDKIVISTVKTGAITGVVHKKYLSRA